jgi:hypothetical protein
MELGIEGTVLYVLTNIKGLRKYVNLERAFNLDIWIKLDSEYNIYLHKNIPNFAIPMRRSNPLSISMIEVVGRWKSIESSKLM